MTDTGDTVARGKKRAFSLHQGPTNDLLRTSNEGSSLGERDDGGVGDREMRRDCLHC
jgi:hypothetical protein